MSTQEKIISLLQGDMKDEAQVASLIEQLSSSSEDRQLLLEYIKMDFQVEQFIKDILPSSKFNARLHTRIEEFEKNINKSDYRSDENLKKKNNRHVWRRFFVALVVGFGLGYWFGYNNEGKRFFKDPSSMYLNDNKTVGPIENKDSNINHSAELISGLNPAKVKVAAGNHADNFNKKIPNKDLLNAALRSVKNSDIRIASPNGGEAFKSGSRVSITWTGDVSNKPSMALEFSPDGGLSWGEIGMVEHSYSKLWTIPNVANTSEQCLVRIAVEDTVGFAPQLLRTFQGHQNAVTAAEISPDGKFLATVGSDANVFLWDLQTGKLVRSMIGHSSPVTFAKFNRAGTSLASCSQDGTVRIWDVETGKQEHELKAQGDGKKVVWTAAYSPDGSTIAVANDDGTVTFWDTKSGEEIKFIGMDSAFKPHAESVRYIEYSADGRYIITCSVDETAAVINAQTGQILRKFTHHVDYPLPKNSTKEQRREALRRRTVNGVQMTPDGKILIIGGYNGFVNFWNIKTGELIRSKEYHNGEWVSSIVLSSNGKLLASVGYDGTSKIIDVNSGEILATIASPVDNKNTPMIQSSFSKDMRFLAIAHVDGRATIWKLRPTVYSDISDSFWSIEPCQSSEPKID